MDNSIKAAASLLGLGALAPAQQEQVLRVVQNDVYSKGQKQFAVKLAELSDQAQSDIASGAAKFADGRLYVAHVISGTSGIEELLTSALSASAGITNFDESKVPADVNLLATAMKIEYGNIAAGTADKIDFFNVGEVGDIPSSIANGEITVTVGGVKVINEMPMAEFFGMGAGSTAGGKAIVVNLDAPKFFKAGAKVNITIRKPLNGILLANVNAIRVTFLGPQTSSK